MDGRTADGKNSRKTNTGKNYKRIGCGAGLGLCPERAWHMKVVIFEFGFTDYLKPQLLENSKSETQTDQFCWRCKYGYF